MKNLLDTIENSPIVPVYYNDDIELCKQVIDDCYAGGVRVFEFVNRGSKALGNLSKILNYRNEYYSDLLVGIGTVKTSVEALAFIELGVDFIVSPIFNSEIAAIAHSHNVPWVPGCMTPTEIANAERLGIDFVKLFPGEVLGDSFVKAIKPLFPNMSYMVTGGVSLSNNSLEKWFKSGVSAVGVGSKLFQGEFTDSNDVISNLKMAISFVQECK